MKRMAQNKVIKAAISKSGPGRIATTAKNNFVLTTTDLIQLKKNQSLEISMKARFC